MSCPATPGYSKTKRREAPPAIWGLDCEMCYTADGKCRSTF